MRGQTKAQVENLSRVTAATGVKICAYVRSIEARVSQIFAYARDRVKCVHINKSPGKYAFNKSCNLSNIYLYIALHSTVTVVLK